MPGAALPWLIGASVGGQVAGAVIGHKAATKAANTQKQAEDRALALQKQMYEQSVARYQPFINTGQSVLPTLRGLASNVQAPMYGTNLRDLSIYGTPPPMPRPVGAGQTPAAAASGGGLVQMQAPDGSTQAVRPELVQHYLQKGAKVVG